MTERKREGVAVAAPVAEKVIARLPPNDGRDWEPQCARCGSSAGRVDCESCDHGYSGHDCGEDTCCCLDPEENMVCEYCDGDCCWWMCVSGESWCDSHPRPGREGTPVDTIEWFTFDPKPAEGEAP